MKEEDIKKTLDKFDSRTGKLGNRPREYACGKPITNPNETTNANSGCNCFSDESTQGIEQLLKIEGEDK